MKRSIGLFAVLLFSSNVSAGQEVKINGSPLALVLSDHNQARVSGCSDFIALRKAGETITDLPGLSDPDYRAAKDALFNCWLQAYAVKNGMVLATSEASSLADVLKHFPASAAYIVSNEETEKVEKGFSNKTIMDYTPDLKIDSERATSASAATGYLLDSDQSFTDHNGHTLRVIGLVGYSIGGTAANKVYWRVDDTNSSIWKITKLDENSPI